MRTLPKANSFNDPEFYIKLLRYDDKSYRRWNRLTEKQRKQLVECDLFPEQLNYTLKVFHLLKSQFQTESIPFALNVYSITYEGFHSWVKACPEFKPKYLNPSQALKELIFRGYKRLNNFHVKPKRSYVMTSKPMEDGYFYIHPFEMGSNYNMTVEKRTLPYLWDTFSEIGLAGYTRVIYPEMENYPNLSAKLSNQLKLDWDIVDKK